MARSKSLYGSKYKPTFKVSSTTANLSILGAGVVLGLVSYPYRESAIGSTLLGAAGSMAAVAFILFMRELFVDRPGNPILDA